MKTVPLEQVAARIKVENPWWAEPHAIPPSFSRLSPRPYLNLFYPLVTARTIRRAVVLLGPRRVGKTVILHHAIQRLIEDGTRPERVCYVAVDHPLYNGLGLEDIINVYGQAVRIDPRVDEFYVFFDEIQYLRDWEIHLKAIVDRYPNIKCIVSGSAAAALRLKSTESGAGRFTNFLLPPLTFHEYMFLLRQDSLVQVTREDRGYIIDLKTDDIDALNAHFVDYLNYGGYPEVAFTPEIRKDPGRFVKSDIVDKVLLRDLPSLYGIQDVQELNYLFTTLAFNTAGEVSLEELSKGSGVAKNTIKKYVEYLEAAFLLRVVHRVDRSAKRFRRANFFKVYLTNPSIRAALFAPVGSEDEAMGDLVETAVFSQWFHTDTPLYYARWHKGEVDIVYLGPNQKAAWAIEAKWTDRFAARPEELRSLLQFCHEQNLSRATVTTRTRTATKRRENVIFEFMPAALYCYMLGYNVIRGRTTFDGVVGEQEPEEGEQEHEPDA